MESVHGMRELPKMYDDEDTRSRRGYVTHMEHGNLSHDRTKLILVYPSRSFDTDCGHKSRRVPHSFVIMSAGPPRRHQICYITLFPVWNQGFI